MDIEVDFAAYRAKGARIKVTPERVSLTDPAAEPKLTLDVARASIVRVARTLLESDAAASLPPKIRSDLEDYLRVESAASEALRQMLARAAEEPKAKHSAAPVPAAPLLSAA